ncbi:MAG: lipase family protein [Alphaproteobacteria bacterium]
MSVQVLEGEQSIKGMDLDEAREMAWHADLPFVYADMVENQNIAPEDAEAAIISAAAQQGLDLTIVNVQDSQAFIALDSASDQVTLAFAPGSTSKNMQFWTTEHFFGGNVFQGARSAFMVEDENGFFADQVRGALGDAIDRQDGAPVDLNIVGMSKGGAIAIDAFAQWDSEGFFTGHPNVIVNALYTFGSPPVGNAEFCENFDARAQEMGMEVWRLTGQGDDIVPDLFTEDAPWYGRPMFTEDLVHVGTQIDLPAVDGHSMEAYIEALHSPQGLDSMVVGDGAVANFPEQPPPMPPSFSP